MIQNIYRPRFKKRLARHRLDFIGPFQSGANFHSRGYTFRARPFWRWKKRGTRWPSIFSN